METSFVTTILITMYHIISLIFLLRWNMFRASILQHLSSPLMLVHWSSLFTRDYYMIKKAPCGRRHGTRPRLRIRFNLRVRSVRSMEVRWLCPQNIELYSTTLYGTAKYILKGLRWAPIVIYCYVDGASMTCLFSCWQLKCRVAVFGTCTTKAVGGSRSWTWFEGQQRVSRSFPSGDFPQMVVRSTVQRNGCG